MKYVKFAVVVLILFFLGYVLGPTLNPMLVKDKEPENLVKVAVKYRGATYQIDLAEYRDTDLPETLEIRKMTNLPTVGGQGDAKLRVGDTVILLNREGNDLIVETVDGIGKGKISPLGTDIYEVLAQKKYDDEAAANGLAVAPTPPSVTTEPEPEREPDPMEPTDPMVQADPEPAPEADPTQPTEEPSTELQPEPEPAGGGKLTDEQIIALMKKNIADEALEEFKTDQVKSWEAGDDEIIDGTEYQIGLAAYEGPTMFGIQIRKAKALISDGKIKRWIYSNTGMQIR